MKEIDIESTNRVNECLAQDALDELSIEKGFEVDAYDALLMAEHSDKTAIAWLRAMLNTDAHYRREFFTKFPETIIRKIVDEADATERNRRESLLAE